MSTSRVGAGGASAADMAAQVAQAGAEAPAHPAAQEAAPLGDEPGWTAAQRAASRGISASAVLARLQRPETNLDEVRGGTGPHVKSGESGERVKSMQRLLNQLGADPRLEEDGVFGGGTAAAVRRFQEQHGCKVDGIVGPETMGAIDRALGLEPDPAAAAASERYRAGGGSGGVSGGGSPSGPDATTGPDGVSGPGRVSGGGGAPGELTGVDRLIDHTARFESGGRYNAWNADDNGHGVSFGLIQFNQEVGSLPSLMRRMRDADPARFDEIMGPHARNMQSTDWVRSANLNDPDIRSRMRRAADEPAFQQVQRDLAREGYFDPAQRMAGEHGITSERGLAMLFDSCVQNGAGGTRRFLREAAAGGGGERAILERFADLADRGRQTGRRHRILADRQLSDAPFDAGARAPAGGAGGAPGTQRPPAAPGAGGANGGSRTGGSREAPPLEGAAPPPEVTGAGGAGGVSGAGETRGGGILNPPIGPGSRVLMIGDSHSVGTYGEEMDRLLRATGATVASYGSSGSSASGWINGPSTSSGWVERGTDGRVNRPADWRDPHTSPGLADLIRRERPDTLVVSLGGNMRGLSPAGIRDQVRRLAEVARENGTRIVWVGPPERRADGEDPVALQRFNAIVREAMAPYGGFVDSSAHITRYAGGDGIHFSGAEGNRISREWAQGVMSEIQGTR